MKVKLLVNLQKYHESLIIGSEGTMIGPFGPQSKQFPRSWVGVKFEHKTLDVLRKHIEPIKATIKYRTEGPILEIESEIPPKLNDLVDFNGIQFKIDSIQEQTGSNIWLVNLRSLQ